MKSSRRILEPPALQLVEEAVHLLRGAPAWTLAVYYLGAVPFVLGLLFFWAHTTWFQPADAEVAWGALGLVVLFGAMKAMQAEFCARLLAQRMGGEMPAWSWARLGRVAIAQMRLQPWTLLVSFFALIVTLPFGWVYAYGQSLTVIGNDERLHHEAATQAKLWPSQNHIGLMMISLLALAAWINLAAAFFLIPWLANRLLGIENIFGFSGWGFFNTTFLASVTALTWLAIDPLVKAFYVLRVFHGRSRRTGEDLRVELQLAQRTRGTTARIAAVVAVAALLWLPRVDLRAAEAANPPSAAVQPAQLDQAIEGVLAGPEFRWRIRPPPGKEAKTPEGPIKRFVRQGVETIQEMFRAVGRAIKRVTDWIDEKLKGDQAPREKSASGGAGAVQFVQILLYLFIAVAVVLIGWVIWLIVRSARANVVPVLAARAVSGAVPDLRDENVQAAQLPADGWLALAREQAALGEWRLALRALYLATLARLAAEGLISLAKFKTNLDYEREVRRRALSREEVTAAFARRRREFEDVWYGRAEAAETNVRQWLTELEGR